MDIEDIRKRLDEADAVTLRDGLSKCIDWMNIMAQDFDRMADEMYDLAEDAKVQHPEELCEFISTAIDKKVQMHTLARELRAIIHNIHDESLDNPMNELRDVLYDAYLEHTDEFPMSRENL